MPWLRSIPVTSAPGELRAEVPGGASDVEDTFAYHGPGQLQDGRAVVECLVGVFRGVIRVGLAEPVVRRRPGPRPPEDLVDDRGLGVGVVLDVLPGPLGQLTLGPRVVVTLRVVGAHAVAEGQIALDFLGGRRIDVQVDVSCPVL
jgi:hypothetical protein